MIHAVCRLSKEVPKMWAVGAASTQRVTWVPVDASRKGMQRLLNDIDPEEWRPAGAGRFQLTSGPFSVRPETYCS